MYFTYPQALLTTGLFLCFHGSMKTTDEQKQYMREYMRDYRAGKKRPRNTQEIHKKMCSDRLRGDSIYEIGLRYGYNPVYICRLFKNLPVQKHANRHKLYWSLFYKSG